MIKQAGGSVYFRVWIPWRWRQLVGGSWTFRETLLLG
jgi:hypothetical protein